MDDRLPTRAPARNPWIQGDLGSGQAEVTARQPPRPAGGPGETFDVVALTVLPTLYLLGVFTFVRIVERGAEDFRYGVAINRIRNYYKQIAGKQAKLFLLSGYDDARGVFANAAVPARSLSLVSPAIRTGRRTRGAPQVPPLCPPADGSAPDAFGAPKD